MQRSGHVDDNVQISGLDAFCEIDGGKNRYIGEVLDWYRGERDFDKVADGINIQRPRIHLRESRKRKIGDNKKIRRLQEKGKHTGKGNLEASAYYANFNFAKKKKRLQRRNGRNSRCVSST